MALDRDGGNTKGKGGNAMLQREKASVLKISHIQLSELLVIIFFHEQIIINYLRNPKNR